MNSEYYNPDPDKACLFLPNIDLLNQNNVRLDDASRILNSLSRSQSLSVSVPPPLSVLLTHKLRANLLRPG